MEAKRLPALLAWKQHAAGKHFAPTSSSIYRGVRGIYVIATAVTCLPAYQ